MLEITGKEISELNDSDLRTLVGRLCEADLRMNNLPVSGATWGGHQDEADGGIDVRVDCKKRFSVTGFIPSSQTGFQVKKPDLSPNQIIDEMCPKGKLREAIIELTEKNGAYIIICGNASTTDLKLRNRIAAMKKAIDFFGKKESFTLDYYDRDRLATWVRCHPSLIIWVKEKIGTPVYGWQPFRNWSKHNDDIEEEYFVDDKVRIFEKPKAARFLKKSHEEGITVIDGINLMRQKLSSSKSSIRFVGLSGYGKTRLIQALFDSRLGKNSLNSYEVIYGDVNDNLTPDPKTFIQQIVTLNQNIILAVDNCKSSLHRQLNKISSSENSKVKLITIEYDIQEDEPELTKIFRLELISDELLKKIIASQFPYIGYINIENIIESSGGNPRIAIALAKTIKEGETVDYLKDNELFNRLFFQRNKVDEELMKSAEVCSLVYSFDSQTVEGEDAEMKILADLIEISKKQLFRHIATLVERDLVQKRNRWRAVLPHAVANKLASRALKTIPLDSIIKVFEGSPERMLKSFFRRLNYLQKSSEAKEIANRWMSERGMLGNLHALNSYNLNLLNYIALLSPEFMLEAIEKASTSAKELDFTFPKSYQFQDFSKIIAAIAYSENFFNRSIGILFQFYFSFDSKENKEWILGLLKSLFYVQSSRTHAPLDIRMSIVNELIESELETEFDLGIELLDSLLKVQGLKLFHSNPIFNKYHKDYGWRPKNKEGIDDWFLIVLNYCKSLILKGGKFETHAKILVAEHFKFHCYFIWSSRIFIKLEEIMRLCSKEKVWVSGWLAIRETIRFRQKKLDEKKLGKLQNLEKELRPVTLIDEVRAFALSSDRDAHALIHPDEVDDESWWKKLEEKVKDLGVKVVNDKKTFEELIPELVTQELVYRNQGYSFGQGLAKGSKNPIEIWEKLTCQLKTIPKNNQSFFVINGFLWELSKINANAIKIILDAAILDDFLITVFPLLQSCVERDDKGWERIMKSLNLDVAPIFLYRNLLNSKFNEATYHDDLRGFLEKLIIKEGGIKIVIQILSYKIFSKDSLKKRIPNREMKSFARNVLTKIIFDRKKDYMELGDFYIERIVDGCFEKDNCVEGKILCENILNASLEHQISLFNFPQTINNLARHLPTCFLNTFLGNEDAFVNVYRVEFNDELDSKVNPLSQIEDKIILDWCSENPETRFPIIATSIKLFRKNETTDSFELTNLAIAVLNHAPDVKKVLKSFVRLLRPSSWSGKRTDLLRRRLPLLDVFKSHKNKDVREWGMVQEKLTFQEIAEIEKRQAEEFRDRDERFEY